MIEFKQIIGRGTRLFDGKDFFTIHDFVNASFNFSDPEWDGEPGEPVEPTPGNPTNPTTPTGGDGGDDGGGERPRMVIVELGEGKALELQGMTTQRFYSVDGKVITLMEFVRSLFDKLPEFFKTEEELRAIWSAPESRKLLLEQLRDAGFPERILKLSRS